MVHWLGEGTNVLICLAREPPPLAHEVITTPPSPSSVFISYDYGDTFQDKTADFRIKINETTEIASTLDQFITHSKYHSVSIVISFKYRVTILVHIIDDINNKATYDQLYSMNIF